MTIDSARAKSIFLAASELSDPAQRANYLNQQCGSDGPLRARVEALLSADDAATFLSDKPSGPALDVTTDIPELVQPGTLIAGRYKLRQQIGEGGMGTVWMADQAEPVKRKVAVKLISVERGQSKTILARFEAERQAIALMDHPHIAKLLDAGTTETGAPFFVMELVKGIPLNDYCDQHKLTIADRLNLFTQICSAVQHAHQKGIIHRDLKPSNILVESHDGKPVPKVIDFGLAKATGLQLGEHSMFTAFGSVMGTPLYMAPEQANFNAVDVDTRADVYALGVILYELLTGTTPITRETMKKAALDEMLKLIREQEAPTPSSRLSSVDSAPSVAASRQMEPLKLGRFVRGELDWIVLKALSKDRDRRYETANGFARDIERFLNHEPVTAGPPSASYRFQKFVQRNRAQVIAASLVLLALLAGIAGTSLGLWEARKQAAAKEFARAEEAKQRASAEANEKRADEEKQIAESVKDFLQNKLLAQADAMAQADALIEAGELSEEAKYNPTILELLDRAAKELTPDKIEANFPNQPLVQAELLRTVGNAYRGIGGIDKARVAIELFTRSVELFRQHHGSDHPDTLTSMNNLAEGYQAAGQLDKALPLYEETLELRKAKLGSDHPDTLTSMNKLAGGYHYAGQLDKALPLNEETLKLRKAELGPDHPDTLYSMGSLAINYQAAGQLDKALPLHEEALKLRKAKLGPDHPATLSSMSSLAMGYKAAGQLDKALPLLEETLELRKAKLGPDHPSTLTSMNNLALAYQSAGQLDKALRLNEETFKLLKAKLGPDHPSTLSSMVNLATSYRATGQLDKAVSLYEEALKLFKAKFGPDHPATLSSMNNLAMGYRDAGQLDKALPLLAETLDLRKAKLGPDHPDTLNSMNNLAGSYEASSQFEKAEFLRREQLSLAKTKSGVDSPGYSSALAGLGQILLLQKKWMDAEPILRESLTIREKTQPDAWTTFNVHSLLGGALLGQKKFADAEPLLLKGYEGMKDREKTIPAGSGGNTRIPQALDRLIELYTATDKPDEVTKWQAERAKYPPAASPTASDNK